MKTITLKREPNLFLSARDYKILIDNVTFDNIGDGESKQIEIPKGANQLTIKISNYTSEPLFLNNLDSDTYTIKQNLLLKISTYGMTLFAAVFFFTKYILAQKQILFLILALPFLLVSVYYLTFGKKKAILLNKFID